MGRDQIKGATLMYWNKSFWSPPFILAMLVASVSLPASAQDLDDLPVGTIQNFGPNLQTIANGICRQPEGLAIDADATFMRRRTPIARPLSAMSVSSMTGDS